MQKDIKMMGVMAVLCVNVVTASVLLNALFVSGALAACDLNSDVLLTTPEEMEALSGSCLQIPCSYRIKSKQRFNTSRGVFGVWIKSNPSTSNVIFNSSGTVETYPMEFIGALRKKNCTTLFSNLVTKYTDKYFLRIENWPYVATAMCNPLQITVKDSPWRPRIKISGDLKEEESVTVTCSALTPCPHSPPKLTWNLQQDSHNLIEGNANGTFMTKIQTTFTLSDQHDGNTIICSAAYPVNQGRQVKTAEERINLSVQYSPRDATVHISPTDLVSVGSAVNLTCSCRGNPPVHFVWFMISESRLELIKIDTQVYNFKVTDSDRGRMFYCGCRNDLDIHLSKGLQLMFEGSQPSELVGVQVIVKATGILMLIITLVIFECWFSSRCCKKSEKIEEEADYVNAQAQVSS